VVVVVVVQGVTSPHPLLVPQRTSA
jgi:hypothetical protein